MVPEWLSTLIIKARNDDDSVEPGKESFFDLFGAKGKVYLFFLGLAGGIFTLFYFAAYFYGHYRNAQEAEKAYDPNSTGYYRHIDPSVYLFKSPWFSTIAVLATIYIFWYFIVRIGKGHHISGAFDDTARRSEQISRQLGGKQRSTIDDLNKVSSQNGFYIAAMDCHWWGDGHILTVGESGSGKNAALIIPNFISPRFLATGTSVFCLDPKGENFAVCNRAMEQAGYQTYLLNPTNMHGVGTFHFNLFDMTRWDSPDVFAFCQTVARALSPSTDRSDVGAHFSKRSQRLLNLYMLYNLYVYDSDMNFVKLYDSIMLEGSKRTELLDQMMKSNAYNGIVASEAAAFRTAFDMGGEKELSGVYAEAEKALQAFVNPQMRAIVQDSDFSLHDLLEKPTAIFLNVPFTELEDYAGWIRAINSVMYRMVEARKNRDRRILVMLDEFVQLGYVKEVENGIVTMRSFGITYHISIQGLQQLKKIYPGSNKSFFGSAAIINALEVKDPEAAKMLSDMTGTEYKVVEVGKNKNEQVFNKPVVAPNEFQNNYDHHYLFVRGVPNVMKMKKVYYFNNQFFKGRYDRNPAHHS
ncbi:hypothetical protein GCM10027347_59210 [Larkinella harenae]